ncbi:MAG: substrate-binding domain-containing protein [Acidimicrobiales bacterium]
MKPTTRVAIAIVAAMGLVGCGSDGDTTVVMVPSSFTGLTASIDTRLDIDTDWVIAGSSRLVRQLADGAAADVLITADAETMADAVDQGLVAGEPVVVARNRLVVALAPGNQAGVAELDDLADPDLLIGVCAAEVPCGRLAARAVDSGLDLAVDTEEPNVRSLALKIARGELDAGLVYATDAADLGLATLDDDSLTGFETAYLAASVRDEPSPIIDFLRADAGRDLLEDEGFLLP